MERISRVVRSVLNYLKDSRGASLYEITAAVAMASILAAVAAPIVIERVGEAKVARAVGEVDAIWNAMQNFQRDTGKMPGEGDTTKKFLLFTGQPTTKHAELPGIGTGVTFSVGGVSLTGASPTCTSDKCANINDYLVRNPDVTKGTYQNWKGPYVEEIFSDPFDRAYIINVAPLYTQETPDATHPNTCGFGWIISGSADRTLQTPVSATALTPDSDDIGKNRGKKIGPGTGCTGS